VLVPSGAHACAVHGTPHVPRDRNHRVPKERKADAATKVGRAGLLPREYTYTESWLDSLHRPVADLVAGAGLLVTVSWVGAAETHRINRRRLPVDDAVPNVRGTLVIGGQRVGVYAGRDVWIGVAQPG